MTLACEDAYSKLVEVVTVPDESDEDRVVNSLLQIWKLRFGHNAKLLFWLWAQGLVCPVDHLQEVFLSCWSFTRCLSILLIICNRLIYPDDHLQEASHSRWSFERGQSIRMIICKRPPHPEYHLQEACPSGWSFARGRSIQIIICKRPVNPDDPLQEAGPSGWSFAGNVPILV